MGGGRSLHNFEIFVLRASFMPLVTVLLGGGHARMVSPAKFHKRTKHTKQCMNKMQTKFETHETHETMHEQNAKIQFRRERLIDL